MKKIKLLLVDDEVPFVETMTKRLKKREFGVDIAHSGLDAPKLLESNDKLERRLVSVKMPGMDGIDTLREIKKIYPLTEVVMLTGHATVESAIEGMRFGAFDYLMKPCDIEQLVSKVTQAAEKKQKHENKIVEARIKEITARHA